MIVEYTQFNYVMGSNQLIASKKLIMYNECLCTHPSLQLGSWSKDQLGMLTHNRLEIIWANKKDTQ